nr:HlyD family efflux transporter periplasmic adaptor subunit [Crateriforma spongiae]
MPLIRPRVVAPVLATRRLADSRRGGLMTAVVVLLVLVGVSGFLSYKFYFGAEKTISLDDLITTPVSRGSFDHVVLEQGEIESSSNIEVICEVKSRGTGGTPILWVIDEGARVKKGDKLVELDSSSIEELLNASKISVITAEASVATAEAAVEQAKIARQEYLEGVFKTEERAIKSEMAVAEQELRKAQLALQSSERLVAKGLVKSLQLEADKFAVANARNQLEAAEGRLRVLQNLTRQKMLVQFDSDIEAAEATLGAARSDLMEKEREYNDLQKQLDGCVMYAPADGVVVHANKFSSRGGNAEFVVEAGANVRERQALINLPDPTQMQIKCTVNESRITLIQAGMPVRIRIDALPGTDLRGVVTKVNRYAEPGSWFSSSVKEYATIVKIIDPPDNIRTGMTAEAQIFVEQLDDALQIPIQGLYEHGGEMYSLVKTGEMDFETRQVDVNATNDTMASIDSGLEENEIVVLNLREHLNLMDLPELTAEDNSDLKELRDEDAARKGDFDGPSGPRAGGPGAGGPGAGGPGGRPGPGGPGGGGPGAGGPGGGGAPDINTIVTRSMERNDTDGDGKLSAEEIQAVDGRFRSRLESADADGDGVVTRAELTKGLRSAMGSGGGPQ